MRKLICIIAACLTISSMAQPPLSQRARRSYPTTLPIENDDIEWQRNIYRELDLSNDSNAGLYYREEGENLFMRIFRLVLQDSIPAYEYNLNGGEVFNNKTRIVGKNILDDYHIFYEERDGQLMIADVDIPSDEVRTFYLKEAIFYNAVNSSFRARPLALCPVLVREDDFGDEPNRYPMFWVKYADLEPFLKDLYIYASSRNMASYMPAADYFTRNLYRGEIYKVFNTQNQTLRQYCPDDSTYQAEQRNIERNLRNVRRSTYNIFAPADPVSQPKTAQKKSFSAPAEKKPERTKAAPVKENTSKGNDYIEQELNAGNESRVARKRKRTEQEEVPQTIDDNLEEVEFE